MELKQQLARQPFDVSLASELADQLLMLGRREEASRVLVFSHSLQKDAAVRGRLVGRVGVVSRALLSGEGARLHQAGVNALIAGNHRAALGHLGVALRTEGPAVDLLARKGQAELLSGQPDLAAETFRLAVRMNPFEPVLRLWLGYVLLVRGERSAGERELQQAWRGANAQQRRRPHWRAWHDESRRTAGVGGASSTRPFSVLDRQAQELDESAGWEIWAALKNSDAALPISQRYLNLFPKGYQRLVGESGLDLLWWDPEVLQAEIRRRQDRGAKNAAALDLQRPST